ncbi:hypothetical protein CARUB_v100247330mg, partial [Capsella rubella]
MVVCILKFVKIKTYN